MREEEHFEEGNPLGFSSYIRYRQQQCSHEGESISIDKEFCKVRYCVSCGSLLEFNISQTGE